MTSSDPKNHLYFNFFSTLQTWPIVSLLKFVIGRGVNDLSNQKDARDIAFWSLSKNRDVMGPKQIPITLTTTREFWKFCCHLVALAPRDPKNPKTSIISKGKGFKFRSEELQCNDFIEKSLNHNTFPFYKYLYFHFRFRRYISAPWKNPKSIMDARSSRLENPTWVLVI